MQLLSKLANEKTPGDRADLHQFRHARDATKDSGQHVTAHRKRRSHQNGHTHEREKQKSRGQVSEIWLDRKKEDHRQVLKHEHTKRDPSGQRVELLLVVEHLDYDDRAAERSCNGQIKGVPFSATESESAETEKNHAERNSAENLHKRCESNGTAGTGDFLQVDLQPDHEEQKNQSQLRNGRDRFGRLDKAESHGTECETAGQISEEQRLPRKLRTETEQPCGHGAIGDIAD